MGGMAPAAARPAVPKRLCNRCRDRRFAAGRRAPKGMGACSQKTGWASAAGPEHGHRTARLVGGYEPLAVLSLGRLIAARTGAAEVGYDSRDAVERTTCDRWRARRPQHNCFAWASDTVVMSGPPVAAPGIAYAAGRILGQQAHWRKGRVGRAPCGARPPSEPGRARFRASGSSKPLRLVGGQKCQTAAVVAADVCETGFVVVRRGVLRGDDLGDSLAGACQPYFPLAWVLWPVVVGQERVPADRAVTVLGFEEPPAGVVDRQGCLALTLGPVVGKRRVVG